MDTTLAEERLMTDIEDVSRMPFLTALLDVVCAATGLGFAAVARVTEERWIAGGVRDDLQFGLKAGVELPVASTICHEIRQSREPVIIEHVSEDARYCQHHTPALYGFESYISFPILQKDGSFFGTVCAIDPKPASLNTPLIVGLFKRLAELIAMYIDGRLHLAPHKLSKMESYATAELRNTRSDLAAQEHAATDDDIRRKTRQLGGRLDLLLLALEPQGSFMA